MRLLVFCLISACLLSACGYKGPLFLPGQGKAPASASQGGSTP
ncbi:lipoprotein [Chitinimonas arctica]|uniref:Lipoprotein n=1 Tax=Chitinimonas arctica TaxID=2594795 RepID=A0A516SI21_9NEIS|nr:lipoprotein [Chitinimonas arctica]